MTRTFVLSGTTGASVVTPGPMTKRWRVVAFQARYINGSAVARFPRLEVVSADVVACSMPVTEGVSAGATADVIGYAEAIPATGAAAVQAVTFPLSSQYWMQTQTLVFKALGAGTDTVGQVIFTIDEK